MTRTLLRLALLVLTLFVLTPPPGAHAQGLATLAVATSTGDAGATSTLQPKPGCWDCTEFGQIFYCGGGYSVGYWNCSVGYTGCNRSSYGCGGHASVPVDLDGAAQYVSRAVLEVREASQPLAAPGEDRNCDGIVVARRQSPDNIVSVRTRTAALTL